VCLGSYLEVGTELVRQILPVHYKKSTATDGWDEYENSFLNVAHVGSSTVPQAPTNCTG
jgi:hypothetical protein